MLNRFALAHVFTYMGRYILMVTIKQEYTIDINVVAHTECVYIEQIDGCLLYTSDAADDTR